MTVEKVIRQQPVNPEGTILNRLLKEIAYADDVVVIARNQEVLENFIVLEKKT